MVASCRRLLAGVSAAVVGVCATPAAALQYQAPVQLTAASTCAATVGVVVADFDADGNKDLAVAGPTCARILLQNGATGQFPADRVLTISGEHITAITSGDATGDGKPDLLIAESAADGSWPLVRVIYRNAQNGLINENFSQGSAYIFTGDFVPSAVVAAKVDGDALPDLLVLDRTNGLLRTLVGQGTTTPVTSWSNTGQTLAVGSTPVAMVAGEFDNTLWTDHDDVAILSKDDATVTVLHTTAEEPTTWSTAKTIPLPDGTFSQPAPDPGGVGGTVDPTMAVVQVDPNSANGDLVIQDPGGSSILIRRASEYPGFGSEVAALPLSADGKLAVASVNDDNRLDLVLGAADLRFTAASLNDCVTTYFCSSTATAFGDEQLGIFPSSFIAWAAAGRNVAAGELNGDGRADVVAPDSDGTLWLARSVGPATDISVQLDPSSIAANGSSTTTATATVADVNGQGVVGETVTFSDPGHTVGTVTDHGDGTYSATITSTTTAGDSTVTATDGSLTADATLTQTPGIAADISVDTPASLVANGTSTTTVIAHLADQYGNAVPGGTVTFASDGGQTVGSTTDNGDGSYSATVTSTTAAGTSTITATETVRSISDTATLTQVAGPAASVSLALSPSSIPANGTSTSSATVTVKDTNNNLVSGDTVTVGSTGTGHPTVGTVTDNHDGTYSTTITSSTTAGTYTITAADGSRTDSKTLTQTAGPATTVAVSLSPTSILANGTSTSTATATVTDTNGNAVSGHTVSFASSDPDHDVSSTAAGSAGTYTATITSSTTVGTATITATDSTPTTPISGTATLTQTRGPATNVVLSLDPSSIVANGTSTSTATATVTDAQGHPAAGDTVTITSPDGQDISAVEDNGDGTYTATITSTSTTGTSTITANDTTTNVQGTAALTQRDRTAAGPPTASISSPAGGGTYNLGATVATTYACTAYPGDAETAAGGAIDGCTDSRGGSGTSGTLDTSTAGSHTYTVTAHSSDGQSGTASITYTVRGAPTATITSPAGGATYARDQVVATAFSCADGANAPGIATCTDSNGETDGTGALDTATLGAHTYTVTATSQAGLSRTRSISYTVAAAPGASITAPGDNQYFRIGEIVSTTFGCTEGTSGPGIATCVDSEGASSPNGTLDTSTTGSHTYIVTATSQDGQTGTASLNYGVAAPPTATIAEPGNNQNYTLDQVVATSFSCAEGAGGPGIASCLDGAGHSSPGTLDTSTPGNRTYTVTATSQDGQTGTRSITYTVAGPPSASISAPDSGGLYAQGSVVGTDFGCAEGASGPGLASCTDSRGSTAPHGNLDTSTVGEHTYTVTAKSHNGRTAAKSIDYRVAGAPTITIDMPKGPDGERYYGLYESLFVGFSCEEGAGGPGLASCAESTTSLSPAGILDTSTVGNHNITIVAVSKNGLTTTRTERYVVGVAPTATLTGVIADFPQGERNMAVMSCASLNGQPLVSCQATQDGTDLDGCDTAASCASADYSRSFRVDTSTIGRHDVTLCAVSSNRLKTCTVKIYVVHYAPIKAEITVDPKAPSPFETAEYTLHVRGGSPPFRVKWYIPNDLGGNYGLEHPLTPWFTPQGPDAILTRAVSRLPDGNHTVKATIYDNGDLDNGERVDRTTSVSLKVRVDEHCISEIKVGSAEVGAACWLRDFVNQKHGYVEYTAAGDVTVNGLKWRLPKGPGWVARIPNDPSQPSTLKTIGDYPAHVDVAGDALQKGPVDMVLPSAATATPAPKTPGVYGKASEVRIKGIGPSQAAFHLFGLPVTSPYGVEWFSGVYADGRTYTRVQADLKVPGFKVPKTAAGRSPDVTVQVSVRYDDRGEHVDNVFGRIENAKFGEQIGIEDLCVSYVSRNSLTYDTAQNCKAFKDSSGNPYVTCVKPKNPVDRWDLTADVQLPFVFKGFAISGGLSDNKLNYLAADARLGRLVPLTPANNAWLTEVRAGFCVGPPLIVKAGVSIGVNKSFKKPEANEIDIDGDIAYSDSYQKQDLTCESRIALYKQAGLGIPVDCRGATAANGWTADIPWRVEIGNPASPVLYKVEGTKVGWAYFTFGGNKILVGGLGLDYDAGFGSFTVNGAVIGWVSLANGRFNVEGSVKACGLWGGICFKAEGLVSTIGVEACATVIPAINLGPLGKTPSVRAGASVRWGSSPSFMAPSCDIGKFRVDVSTGRRRVAGGVAGTTVTVPADTQVQVLQFHGDGAPPKVRLHGPGGEIVEAVDGPDVDLTKSFVVQNPRENVTIAMLVKPTAGTWTAEPLDGTKITSVDAAHDVPRPVVTGAVAKNADGSFTLNYSFVPQAGVAVSFEEVGADNSSQKVLGEAPEDCSNPCAGTIKFTPAVGYGGGRNIHAIITRDGLPVDNQQFASYVAPDLVPGTVSDIRLTRRGQRLQACWKPAPNATHYEVAAVEVVKRKAKTGTGYQRMGSPKGGCASFPDIKAGAYGLRLSVTAADAMGQKGKTVTRTVRAPRIPMPKPPAGLEIHRSAHRRVVISWLASNASRYGVAVELSNGRKIALSRRIHCRQLVIRRVSPKTKVVAKVFGVRVDGAPGRSIVASLGSKQAVRGVGRRIRGPQC